MTQATAPTTSAEPGPTSPSPSITRPGGLGRQRRTSPIIAGVIVIALAVVMASITTAMVRERPSLPAANDVAPPAAVTGVLESLERTVADMPDDAGAWAELGAAYVDHARVNSDPSAYPKAQRALERSLDLDPAGNWEALASQGALAAGRHDFAAALEFSEHARVFQPQSSFILGIAVDSLTELGRYPEAVEATQAMVDLRPDIASYARVSYQRELRGDVTGAIEAMQSALRASSSAGDRSFATFYLGELEWERGDVDAAALRYEAALRADPTAMQAVAGLGRVAAARGDVAAAIGQYERSVEGFPDPDAYKQLGELYLLERDATEAEEQFRRSAEENAKQAAGGVHVDLELALFSADHRRDLDEGLAAARREWDRRQSVHVADALGWQLFAHGNYAEALVYADRSLALGTRSASFLFHRAEIHRALGNVEAARADYRQVLETNPNFSFLHRGATEKALTTL